MQQQMDGFIGSKISSFGYGNVIYSSTLQRHITLYGHLREFQTQKLPTYIRKKMYEGKSERPRSVFLLQVETHCEKKGEQNSPMAEIQVPRRWPHLHCWWNVETVWIARWTFIYWISEIKDREPPPTPQKIAYRTTSYWLSSQWKISARKKLTPVLSGSVSKDTGTIPNTGEKVGIEISKLWFKLDGASNRNGFPTFETFGWLMELGIQAKW